MVGVKMLNDYLAFETEGTSVYLGSNLDVLPFIADNSVDSIVTDPPYELGFMGKSWDSSGIAYSVELWRECLRVLKPGGHILSFGGSRTWHRLAVAVEDAGFELRDSIAWLYGSGFPKSHDVSKAIDKLSGAEREIVGSGHRNYIANKQTLSGGAGTPDYDITAPATDEAKKWAGWGTALKPAFEPVVVGRKPLIGTVAANVLEWGVGGLNIDGSRIGTEEIVINTFDNGAKPFGGAIGEPYTAKTVSGRWPANIILDPFTAELLDEQQDASRFFYVAKASKRDRNEGLDGLPIRRPDDRTETGMGTFAEKGVQPAQNFHPTVKPTDLMRYLIKLVTPAGGVVLDPFTGSGSTGKAAILDGYKFVGIELTEEYLPIIEGRLNFAAEKYKQENNDEGKLF
jgi:site-specific DNA-methyltransferase (adenine-specific)